MNSFSTKYFLGLSLHPDQICLVEMNQGRVEAIAARELVQPFSLETLCRGEDTLENQGEMVQDLYQKIGAKGNEVWIALNKEMVLVKKIQVAMGSEESVLNEQMTWEAEQILISPLDDYIIEYQRLPFQSSTGNPTYLLVMVRKKVIEVIQSLVKKVGLVLREVDVDVFANIRTIAANYDLNMEETSVLVDIQREYIDFVFIRQREYFLYHRINISEGSSKSVISDSSEIAKLLQKELRRLIFGHRLGQEIEDLSRIFLVGGEMVRNVSQTLSSVVTVPVEVVNPFRRIDVSHTVSKSREFLKSPEIFIASMGAVLRNVPALVK